MEQIDLQYMVDPDELKKRANVPNAVKIVIVDSESIFLTGILGESGRKLVEAGIPFYFTKPLADKLILKGIAKKANP